MKKGSIILDINFTWQAIPLPNPRCPEEQGTSQPGRPWWVLEEVWGPALPDKLSQQDSPAFRPLR